MPGGGGTRGDGPGRRLLLRGLAALAAAGGRLERAAAWRLQFRRAIRGAPGGRSLSAEAEGDLEETMVRIRAEMEKEPK